MLIGPIFGFMVRPNFRGNSEKYISIKLNNFILLCFFFFESNAKKKIKFKRSCRQLQQSNRGEHRQSPPSVERERGEREGEKR